MSGKLRKIVVSKAKLQRYGYDIYDLENELARYLDDIYGFIGGVESFKIKEYRDKVEIRDIHWEDD